MYLFIYLYTSVYTYACMHPCIYHLRIFGSSKKQESSRKTYISALLTMPKPLAVWVTINCGKFWKRWEYQTTLRNLYAGQEATVRTGQEHLFLLYWLAKTFDCVDHNQLWKILKEMGIPDHLTCLLRNLYTDQEATVRTGHGTVDCFQIGKGVRQVCILSPWLFKFYAEYIMRNAGLDEA